MAEPRNPQARRLNRDPTYDLTRHIATGNAGPLSGEGLLRDMDAELDRNDPMDPWTRPVSIDRLTEPRSAEEVKAANLAQAQGLYVDPATLDGQSMDKGFGNRATPNPGEGTDLQYGINNTGANLYRGED